MLSLMSSTHHSFPNLADPSGRLPPSPSSSSQSSLGSLGRTSHPPSRQSQQLDRFSIFVTDISGSRPLSGHSESFTKNAPVKKLVQKRESTMLRSTSSSSGGPSAPEGETSSASSSRAFRVFTTKPSMIHLPGGGNKGPEKARRVRLFVSREVGTRQMGVYSEDDLLIQTVDLSLLRTTDISLVHPSVFNLKDTLLITHRTPSSTPSPSSHTSSNHRHSHRPPPSPSSPVFPDAYNSSALGRTVSQHLGGGASSSSSPKSPRSSPRRPSTASATASAFYLLPPGSSRPPPTQDAFTSSSPPADQLLYLRFPSTESAKTWFALLQSFAIVPTHTTPPPAAGGPNPVWQRALEPTYRVKTRLILRICEFRAPSLTSGSSTTSLSTIHQHQDDGAGPGGTASPAMFVEVQVAKGSGAPTGAGRMVGRTGVCRPGVGGKEGYSWEQEFGFEDLGGAGGGGGKEEVRVVVWKERKMGREGKVGEVVVSGGGRSGMREGEMLEGWYPLLDGSQHAGDLRVKITFTEQIVFSRSYYDEVEATLRDPIRSILPLWKDCDQETVARSLMRSALCTSTSESLVLDLLSAEDLSSDTLFRSSTLFTKVLEVFLKDHLAPFLSASLLRTIEYVMTNGIAIDIKPDRPEPMSGSRRDAMRDAEWARREFDREERKRRKVAADGRVLMGLVETVWADVYASRGMVPSFVRNVFGVLFDNVKAEDRFRAITSILFLRLLVPGMMYPSLFGLTSSLPQPAVHHTLKLVAKSLSGLSFGGLLESKEPEMHALLDSFVKSRHNQVTDFLYAVCRRDPPAIKDGASCTGNGAIIAHLSSLPSREGQLLPPHFLDPAADLATLASCLGKSVDQMVTSGALPGNFESSPSFEKLYPMVGVVGRIIDDEAEVRRLRFQRDSSALSRSHPFSPPTSPLPSPTQTQYALSPPPTAPLAPTLPSTTQSQSPPTKRPARSQTVSSPPSDLSPSLFSPTYALSSNSPRSRSSNPPSPQPHTQAQAPDFNRSFGRRQTALSISAAGGARRPSLPVSMQLQHNRSYPVPTGGRPKTPAAAEVDSEDERDEREERLRRLGRFAGQRAELVLPVGVGIGLGGGESGMGEGEEKKKEGKEKRYGGWGSGWGGGGGKSGAKQVAG